MAGKDLTYRVVVDSSQGTAGIAAFSRAVTREMRQVDSSLEDTATASQRVIDALGRMADEAESELKQATRAVDAFAEAMGPELAAELGRDVIAEKVGELNRLGLTFEEIEADADGLVGALKRVDDVKLSADAAGVSNLTGGVRMAREEADQTRSVLANMVGNSTQTLSGLGGVAGDLGMALGQIGEYATEGGISLRGLAGIAGPMGALAAATALVAGYMNSIKATKAFETERVKSFVEALDDATVQAEELREILSADDDPNSLMTRIGNENRDVEQSVRDTMGTFKEFARVVADGEAGFDEWATSQLRIAAAAGASEEELRNLSDAMEHAKDETSLNHAAVTAMHDGYRDVVETAYAAGAAVRQQGEAAKESGEDTEFYGAAVAAADDNLDGMSRQARIAAASTDHLARRWQALKRGLDERATFLGVKDAFDQVYAAAANAWDKADEGAGVAEAAAREHEQAMIDLKNRVIEYGEQVGGLPPEKVTDILAMIDEGSLDDAERELDTFENQRRETFIDVRLRYPNINIPPNVDTGSTTGRTTRGAVDPVAAGLGAVPALPAVAFAPPPMVVPVTLDVRGGIMGNRYDVVRTVRQAVRDGVRLAGSRG